MSSSVSYIAPRTATKTLNQLELSQPPMDRLPAAVRSASGRVAPGRVDGAHAWPAAPAFVLPMANGTAPVRYRFYPAQLRGLVSVELAKTVAARGQRLEWSGWDRSLPRLYLGVEPLVRLMIEAVDGIARQLATQEVLGSRIRMRANWRAAELVFTVALEADQWQCDPKFRGALNARWFRQSSQSHLWQRLARQCDLVGGWLSVASLPGGGAALLINLPIDQPRALMHSWLTKQLTHAREVPQGTAAKARVSLYAIGRSDMATLEQNQAANARLQSLARAGDYIYRISHGRWAMLTTHAALPDFLRTSAWQTQLMDRWQTSVDVPGMLDLITRIEQRMLQLIGTQVPSLDLRTQHVSRGPITASRPNTRVDHADAPVKSNHLAPQPAKWRYPI